MYHWEPQRHPRMAAEARAAQFAPFAALNGHEEAIEETARWTDSDVTLDDDALQLLDQKLALIAATSASKGQQMLVTITYFEPDANKTGGFYKTTQGYIKQLDSTRHLLILTNGTTISTSQIREIR